MAKVPDLGSDFAQKLLRDLRRRRERLGFESSAAAPRAKGKLPSSIGDRRRCSLSSFNWHCVLLFALPSFFFHFPEKR
jgi:hypothetical protein